MKTSSMFNINAKFGFNSGINLIERIRKGEKKKRDGYRVDEKFVRFVEYVGSIPIFVSFVNEKKEKKSRRRTEKNRNSFKEKMKSDFFSLNFLFSSAFRLVTDSLFFGFKSVKRHVRMSLSKIN